MQQPCSYSFCMMVGHIVEYKMDKTGHLKSISLMPKAVAILKQNKTSKSQPTDFLFPFIDPTLDLNDPMVLFNHVSSCTSLINKYLKEVARLANIEKSVSTHIARYSFANIARTRKASIYDISKMLGHSSIKVTEAYLASFDVAVSMVQSVILIYSISAYDISALQERFKLCLLWC